MNYISLKSLIDRIMISPLYYELKFDAAIIWAVECLNKIETSEVFVDKVENIIIEDHIGELPYDYVKAIKLRINPITERDSVSAKISVDPFFQKFQENDMGLRDYKIEGGYIKTYIEEGTVDLAYKALPVDGDGYPMIPDNTFIILAIQRYVQLQYLEILRDTGTLQDASILYDMEKKYAWAVGQAQSQRQLENLDKMQGVKNAISSLVMSNNSHETDYREITSKEYRRYF